MATHRVFIAVDVSESYRERVRSFCGAASAVCSGVRWTRPENVHLTLKFFGSASDTDLAALRAALGVFDAEARFRICFSGIGAFPNANQPSVLWVGITEGSDSLVGLAEAVDRKTLHVAPSEARPFSPHLTLGRVKEQRHAAGLVERLQPFSNFLEVCVDAESVSLYESTLGSGGPVYRALKSVLLR